jgi:hypothetical protein
MSKAQTQSPNVRHSCVSVWARIGGVSRGALIAGLAALALCTTAAHAQLPAPPATTQDALGQMFDQADVVFTGQVTAIRRIESASNSTGTIEVAFAVDNAIRGAAPNTIYTLREWAGLAPNSDSLFLVGRRYLMLLHAPGPSGLTSPVGVADGVIPILPGNDAASPSTPDSIGLAAQTPHSPARTNLRIGATQADSAAAALAAANSLAALNVDLRWIAARVVAPLAYVPSEPAAAHPITSLARLSRIVPNTQFLPNSWDAAAAPSQQTTRYIAEPAPPGDITTPAQSATESSTYAGVLTLLHSWQEESHAAR